MRQPVIGITWGARPFEKFVPYQRAVEREGGTVLKIDARAEPNGDPLREVDALLFPGGGDVAPHFYGETEVHPTVEAEEALDRLELELAQRAVKAGVPVLGICRGQQVLNVALGGTLYQDLPAAGYEEIDHRAYHPIRLEPSQLSDIVNSREVQVNSRHHQAIRELAGCFTVTAYSADGIVEAVETDDGLVVAVQSHPEDLVDAEWTRRLFRRLLELASKQA